MDGNIKPHSFWNSLAGVITAIATLISAIGGIYIIFIKNHTDDFSKSASNYSNYSKSPANLIDEKQLSKPIEPNIAKIKSDLIGQEYWGWAFESISEIKSMNILSKQSTIDRIEYKIDLKLEDYKTKGQISSQIFVNYLLINNEWSFGSLKGIYQTSFYDLAPGLQLNFTPQAGTIVSIRNHRGLYWTIGNGHEEFYLDPSEEFVRFPVGETYHLNNGDRGSIKIELSILPS